MDPEQYYELAGTDHAAFEERLMPDAEDTVRKELVLEAVATAEGIVADQEEVMHEIGHLAEDSERSAEEIAKTLRDYGTYALLEEEISRQKALDFLVENAMPVPMPEEETEALRKTTTERKSNDPQHHRAACHGSGPDRGYLGRSHRKRDHNSDT